MLCKVYTSAVLLVVLYLKESVRTILCRIGSFLGIYSQLRVDECVDEPFPCSAFLFVLFSFNLFNNLVSAVPSFKTFESFLLQNVLNLRGFKKVRSYGVTFAQKDPCEKVP